MGRNLPTSPSSGADLRPGQLIPLPHGEFWLCAPGWAWRGLEELGPLWQGRQAFTPSPSSMRLG